MKFKVTGEHNTYRVSIAWDEGKLDGPDDLIKAVEAAAERREGQPIYAREADKQIYSTTDHLLNPHSARELIRDELDPNSPFELEVIEGQFPPAPRFRVRVDEPG
jgi:hypothetical protein